MQDFIGVRYHVLQWISFQRSCCLGARWLVAIFFAGLTTMSLSAWTGIDIGNVGAAGSDNISGATGTVTGSGDDIWGAADAFHFTYQQVTGDTTLIARVTSVDNTYGWAKAGLMVRETLGAGSRNAFIFSGPANNSGFQYRSATDGDSNNFTAPYSWAPLWIKLVRAGDIFTAYQSEDGTSWTTIGSITVPMAASVYAGLAVTSHVNGTLCTGTFDTLSISGELGGWTSADIGSVSPSGSDSMGGGVFTVSGSGADIWDTTDAFHFVYQQVVGDGTFVARVTQVGDTNSNLWAKAGLMIRDNLTPNAPHIMMLATPNSNSGIVYRSTSGGTSTYVTGPYSWLPLWIKLVRFGNTFTGYQSEDGSSWTAVGTAVTINLAANAYVGLAVTSHNNGSLCTAMIDNVSVSSSPPPPPPAQSPSEMDYTGLIQPAVGDHALRVISPTLLELRQITTKEPDPARVTSWDFVDANTNFVAPALTQFVVTANGQPVNVVGVGFKRRVFSVSKRQRDLRIDNAIYLQLAAPITDGQAVVVTNPGGQLWPAAVSYAVTVDPLRYSPAIHVNQEGYIPSLPKKAMVGYYLGGLGEMSVPSSLGFSIVDAKTGATVLSGGTLTTRPDLGFGSTSPPYQNVLQADFSSFNTPGEYYLVVPGLGASLPFLIDDGIAMAWMRTYALGMYSQRSGTPIALPFSRFVRDADHTAPAQVPFNDSDPQFAFTWQTIARYASTAPFDSSPQTSAQQQTAPLLTSEANALYPYVNTQAGTVDVSGGHFDAGDYSKYTINCAELLHYLMFTIDASPGAVALDNLGTPDSGDGISDLLQEAKWEADYIVKLQDTDGGFYFIVYPKNREYESNVSLTNGADGDPQVVWPKNTSVTAAAVAALAEAGSSPAMVHNYPQAAALYMQKATLGWNFLMSTVLGPDGLPIGAIPKYGKTGAYQKLTFYGDNWMHNDELAWAAAAMYAATGNSQYQAQFFLWFPHPDDSSTFRWWWWNMSESWGNAIRSYAFAAITGRLLPSQLDTAYLKLCKDQIIAAGDAALKWSNDNAYATSFPNETKGQNTAGWFFSLDQASDMAVAYLINDPTNPNPNQTAYIDAIVGNMNYEGGTNPVNVTYITGLGLKRQHAVVNQYADNSRRVLAPDGVPIGNIQGGFDYLAPLYANPSYGNELSKLTFPADGAASSPYPLYDRWADTWNVTTEFITVNQARSVLALSVLVAQTSAKSTPWTSGTAQITVPTTVVPLGAPTTLSVQAPGFDLTNARIVWEARDQQPAFGSTYTISPINNGPQWVEVEVEWPDGRRVFAASTFTANSPVINWVNGALPAGAVPSADGGDAWTWVTSNPTPFSAPAAHQSNSAAGEHSHWFASATAPLVISVGDNLFAWVYLDPANPPSEVMLTWNDGSADHRAYWGANDISWGTNGTASQFNAGPLPATGQWARLVVPASAVGLEGSTVTGMGFTLFDGRATWDVAGKASADN
jgi:hypothetical protein